MPSQHFLLRGYNWPTISLLYRSAHDEAVRTSFFVAAKIPKREQEALAEWMLEELSGEHQWMQTFVDSQDALSQLSGEAKAEHCAGRQNSSIPRPLHYQCLPAGELQQYHSSTIVKDRPLRSTRMDVLFGEYGLDDLLHPRFKGMVSIREPT
jgi:hypothetical protein